MTAKVERSGDEAALLSEIWKLQKTNPAIFISRLEAWAASGSITAMLNLGNVYRAGKPIQQDIALAEKWYRMAAEAGSTRGLFRLTRLRYYEFQDYQGALEAFHKPPLNRYGPTLCLIGIEYMLGTRLGKDVHKAKSYLEQAAALGHIIALGRLSRLLMQGHFGILHRFRGAGLAVWSIGKLLRQEFIDHGSDKFLF